MEFTFSVKALRLGPNFSTKGKDIGRIHLYSFKSTMTTSVKRPLLQFFYHKVKKEIIEIRKYSLNLYREVELYVT
jgi:hypothetical protein